MSKTFDQVVGDYVNSIDYEIDAFEELHKHGMDDLPSRLQEAIRLWFETTPCFADKARDAFDRQAIAPLQDSAERSIQLRSVESKIN